MKTEQNPDWVILVPFDRREGMSLTEAAYAAGKSVSTARNWCTDHGLGRRVGDGTWVVSKVALAMWLDGDLLALAAYHGGDRSGPAVEAYFARAGLLPSKGAEAATATTSAKSSIAATSAAIQ